MSTEQVAERKPTISVNSVYCPFWDADVCGPQCHNHPNRRTAPLPEECKYMLDRNRISLDNQPRQLGSI